MEFAFIALTASLFLTYFLSDILSLKRIEVFFLQDIASRIVVYCLKDRVYGRNISSSNYKNYCICIPIDGYCTNESMFILNVHIESLINDSLGSAVKPKKFYMFIHISSLIPAPY